VLLPRQLDEVASVAQQLKTKLPIKLQRAPDVPHHDLGHELLGRINVVSHGNSFLSNCPTEPATLPRDRPQDENFVSF
jgi:hypothetical protein